MGYMIHAANVAILISFTVRDILWLRLLSVVAGVCFVLYFSFKPQVPWEPIAWNALFMCVNFVQIYRLLLDRRPVHLAAEEQRLYQLVFRTLTPREMARLLEVACWRDVDAGSDLLREGEPVEGLLLIVAGEARVNVRGEQVATLGEGKFVGEISYLTGEAASAAVSAQTALRYVEWPKQQLGPFLEKHEGLRSALQLILGTDLARKLRSESAPSPA